MGIFQAAGESTPRRRPGNLSLCLGAWVWVGASAGTALQLGIGTKAVRGYGVVRWRQNLQIQLVKSAIRKGEPSWPGASGGPKINTRGRCTVAMGLTATPGGPAGSWVRNIQNLWFLIFGEPLMSEVQVMYRCSWIAPCTGAAGLRTGANLQNVMLYLPKECERNRGRLPRALIGTMGT